MRDKVVLGVTLSIVLLLTFAIYVLVDTQRGPAVAASDLERSVNSGRQIYAQYCIQCHGPLGEGCIGPALNRTVWRPVLPNGDKNKEYDDASHDFIKKTVERGRNSNQPGIQMPAWSINENGALNDQDIEDVVSFIQHGDWNLVLEGAASATNLSEPLPSFPGFTDQQKLDQVKQLMLTKGCLNCHTMGKAGGNLAAPLTDVGSRRSVDWLRQWIHDPKAMPPTKRGPNLWLVGPTPTLPGLPTQAPSLTPTATPQAFPMNTTYMPTIQMTDAELNLLVDYLSHARTTTR
ncbi:MAG TPA: cytochrome c [Chloroflexota bacterium]